MTLGTSFMRLGWYSCFLAKYKFLDHFLAVFPSEEEAASMARLRWASSSARFGGAPSHDRGESQGKFSACRA